MTTNLTDLPNLGPVSVGWLHDVGIVTTAQLAEVGIVETYCLVKARQPRASLNLLYALYGAIHAMRWQEISPEVKAALQAEVAAFRFGSP